MTPAPDVFLTALELAARWKLLDRKGRPSAARVNALVAAGHLPGAFRVNAGTGPRGPRDWRVPMADVAAYEEGRRARPRAEEPRASAAPRRPGRPKAGAPAPRRKWTGL